MSTNHFLLFICFSLNLTDSNAQAYQTQISGENFRFGLISNGRLFSFDQNGIQSAYEIPKNSSKHTIYTSSFWLSAIDSATNELHISATTYPGNFESFFEGPIRNSPFNDLTRNGIFDISTAQVNDFLNNYTDPSYLIPGNILNWIGNGNSNSGMSQKLAPFVDLNQNSNYEPVNEGEYPYAIGDKNYYFVCNDLSGNRQGFSPAVNALGIEVEVYSYLMENQYDIFKDCVLQNLVITNKSNMHYKDVYIGLWLDFDIGNSNDDFVGCDSSLNLFYGYNGGNFDSEYGANVPAQGVLFLNQNLSSFIAYNNTSNAVNGNPSNAIEFNNLLRGKWKDNTAIRTAGNGTGSLGNATNFLFEQNILNESGNGNDKRALGSIGPISLKPGESICIDLAVFHAYDDINGTVQSNLNQLIIKADTLRKAYTSLISSCTSGLVNRLEVLPSIQKPNIYPNPSKGVFRIENLEEEIMDFSLIDIKSGSENPTNAVTYNLETDHFEYTNLIDGFYLMKIFTKENCYVFKLFLQTP